MITLAEIFDEKTSGEPDKWDISWIQSIQIPSSTTINHAMALKLMTDTARAIDFCGEKIAILVTDTEDAKDHYIEEFGKALNQRALEKTVQQKKAEADADPAYLSKKSLYNRHKGYLEFFKQKQQSFLNMHYALREIAKSTTNELQVANWTTTEESYKERPEKQENTEAEEKEDPDFE